MAKWVEKNREQITAAVKGVLDFAKAAAPFVGAVGLIVGAIKAWRIAAAAAAKAQAFLVGLLNPKALIVGFAAFKFVESQIDQAGKGIKTGMDEIKKEAEKFKKDFNKLLGGVEGIDEKNLGARLQLQALKETNQELKRSEALALEQAKALYGPETNKVIAARIKLAQAERKAAETKLAAEAKGGKDGGLVSAAADAANAQLIAAEQAAKTITDAYKSARNAAQDAADALGEARSKRAGQLFNKDKGINQFLGGQAQEPTAGRHQAAGSGSCTAAESSD